jgi:hypothetical protein
MKKLTLLVVLAVMALVVARRWHAHGHHEGTSLVTDRIWIERMPQGETDTIHALVMSDEHARGMFFQGSGWKTLTEGFVYELAGSELRTTFPQTGSKETFKADARACTEHGFEVCLEMSGGAHGIQHYYSMKDWVIDSQAAADARLATIMHR